MVLLGASSCIYRGSFFSVAIRFWAHQPQRVALTNHYDYCWYLGLYQIRKKQKRLLISHYQDIRNVSSAITIITFCKIFITKNTTSFYTEIERLTMRLAKKNIYFVCPWAHRKAPHHMSLRRLVFIGTT